MESGRRREQESHATNERKEETKRGKLLSNKSELQRGNLEKNAGNGTCDRT